MTKSRTSMICRSRVSRTCLWALLLVAFPFAAWSDSTHDAETREIAQGFMDIQYKQGDFKRAKATYYASGFIQHNPEIPNGMHGDQSFLEARQAKDPAHFLPVSQWTNILDHVLVEDKIFAIHHRVYTNPQDHGRVFFDIFRVENGKIVEHWDIIQPVYENPLNANTMSSDLIPSRAPAADEPSPESVIREYLQVGLDQHDPKVAAERFIADNFRQHSPHIPDGKAALMAYFDKKAASAPANAAPSENTVTHIITDNDLVLVTRHVTKGPEDRGVMYADLFRIDKGKIDEHWDVIQPVPKKSVNGNTMW